MAIYFFTTYNTTNTENKSSSDQLICAHNYSVFCIEPIQLLNLFLLQHILLCILLPNFIIKNHYKLHIIRAPIYLQIPMYDARFIIITCILWCSWLYYTMYIDMQSCITMYRHVQSYRFFWVIYRDWLW